MSGEVALRLVREDDLAMLEDLTQDPAMTGEYQFYGWGNLRRWRRGWDENGLISTDSGTLIATRDGETLGLVVWHGQHVTPAPGAYNWEIGIVLLPQARGHGYGTQAQRLLARYLFAHTTANRVWAATEVENIAEQRALEKAGFTREGVSRGIGWRAGSWRDGVTYSLLRTDPGAQ